MRKPALAFLALVPLTLHARSAAAGINECGDLEITAQSQCELVVGAECTTQCTPLSFTASCAAELYVGCDGMCTLTAEAMCTTDCTASCSAACMVDPGSYECSAECQVDCEGSCSGACVASANMAECMASCRATCSAECDASCTGVAPTATCDAKCQASCSGSCTAEANLDCQVNCQATGYATCTADLQGGCETQCSEPMGALFCDGQYVSTTTLQSCLDYLTEQLDIMVTGYAMCSGNMCEAGASCSCRAASGAPDGGLTGGALAVLGLGLLQVVTRSRRKRA